MNELLVTNYQSCCGVLVTNGLNDKVAYLAVEILD
jgi:hypothetical protein